MEEYYSLSELEEEFADVTFSEESEIVILTDIEILCD